MCLIRVTDRHFPQDFVKVWAKSTPPISCVAAWPPWHQRQCSRIKAGSQCGEGDLSDDLATTSYSSAVESLRNFHWFVGPRVDPLEYPTYMGDRGSLFNSCLHLVVERGLREPLTLTLSAENHSFGDPWDVATNQGLQNCPAPKVTLTAAWLSAGKPGFCPLKTCRSMDAVRYSTGMI